VLHTSDDDLFRIFYWFGEYYSVSLLTQAVLMIFVQMILLKVALDNRAPIGMRAGLEHAPFSAHSREGVLQQILSGKRLYQFWQWPTSRPYVWDMAPQLRWMAVMLMVLLDLQVLPIPSLPHRLPLRCPYFDSTISNLGISCIHRLPGLCRSGHRGHPPLTTDIQEPSGRVV
jgi:hypothetical protein